MALVGLLAGLAIASCTFWAANVVFFSPVDVPQALPYTYAVAEEGDVSARLPLNATATWPSQPVGINSSAGIVTRILVAPGEEAVAGTPLYSVDLRPVILMQGIVPAFRDMSVGLEGQDIVQLQEFLRSTGRYTGPVDGSFGDQTRRAVEAWQKSNDVPADGVVRIGDVIFSEVVPIRVWLEPTLIAVGQRVSGGETAVRSLSSEPTFSLPLDAAQAGLLTEGNVVEIRAPDSQTWLASVGQRTRESDGSLLVSLTGIDNGSICSSACSLLPPGVDTVLASEVIVVEKTHGVTIPTAAVSSAADGTLAVVDETGRRIEIEVLASANGLSVVSGIQSGLRVQVPVSDS